MAGDANEREKTSESDEKNVLLGNHQSHQPCDDDYDDDRRPSSVVSRSLSEYSCRPGDIDDSTRDSQNTVSSSCAVLWRTHRNIVFFVDLLLTTSQCDIYTSRHPVMS